MVFSYAGAMLRPRPLLTLFYLWIFLSTQAAFAEKRPLTPQDYDGWRSLDTPLLSRDGRWLAYGDMPQVDDGHLVVRPVRCAGR